MNVNIDTDTLAIIFRDNRPAEHWDANKRMMWELLLVAVATRAQSDNPSFDRATFFEISGGTFRMLGA